MMSSGIVIDGINTTTFGLKLKSQDIGIPFVKKIYIPIPAGNGSIDLTDSLTGEANYSDREGNFSFDFVASTSERPELIEAFGSYVHGKKRIILLPDDPNFYYIGRLEIAGFTTQSGPYAQLDLKTTCEPYKYKLNPTTVSGIIDVSGTLELECNNSRKRVIPTITTDGAIGVTFGLNTYSLGVGTHTVTNIVFVEGANILSITGAEGVTVSVEYQEGAI